MLPPNLPPKNAGSKGVVLNGMGTENLIFWSMARGYTNASKR